MIRDYKYEMQLAAEQLAERDGLDYFALPVDRRSSYFQSGYEAWTDRQMAAADAARDRAREDSR